VGVAAGLHVAVEVDVAPAHEIAVAAVLGCAVHAFARVVVDHGGKPRVRPEALVLLFGRERREVGAHGGDAVAVALLPADDGAVELAFGKPLRSLDARAPPQLVEAAEAMERREPRVAAETARERASGPDAGWVEMEGAEEAVDVVGDAGLG